MGKNRYVVVPNIPEVPVEKPAKGRPKKVSTKGIVAIIKNQPMDSIDAKYIRDELIDIFTTLHGNKNIVFIEEILEGKWYTSSDIFGWIVEYSKEDMEIKLLGKKIQEILIGRAKKLGQSSQSFTKYLMESEFSYSKKNDKQLEHSALNNSKNTALDTILNLIDEDNNVETDKDNERDPSTVC